MNYSCYCIGNPLVDYIVEADESTVSELGLTKGNFHLYGKQEAMDILSFVSEKDSRLVPGGAAANTACGVAGLGGSAVYSGGIGDDDLGQVFSKSLEDAGVSCRLAMYAEPTGCVAVLVTPDADRTFVVYLGSSLLLEASAVDQNALAQSRFLYFTGYQFEPPGLRNVVRGASNFCRNSGVKVAMDLADAGIVSRTKDELRTFIRANVDIVFSNEVTAREYAGIPDEKEALEIIAQDVSCVFLTLGENGSLIKDGDTTISIDPYLSTPVDTTGAGDMYSAAVLASLDRGCSLEECGRRASYASSQVIQQKGARLTRDISAEIDSL